MMRFDSKTMPEIMPAREDMDFMQTILFGQPGQ